MNPETPPLAAVALPPNPVWRSYAGGSVLRRFRGVEGTADDHFPEDWLASTVTARNGPNTQGPEEGLSHLGGFPERQLLLQSLQLRPEFWFGPGPMASKGTGVLWKLLDASVRLQFQAHPDARFAREHLGSHAGKTECWYIIGVRDEACVYLGFQHPPTREAWAGMIRHQRVNDMLACFERIPVQPGQCFVVPAGVPHAIGAGVFMMELMEPTDWVVRCETVNSGVTLTPEACFMGLDLERCLDIFDFRAHPVSAVRERFQQHPRVVGEGAGWIEVELIAPAWHSFFRLHRIQGTGDASWPGGELMLAVILQGAGRLSCEGGGRSVQAGQTWLLPGLVPQWVWHNAGAPWEILLAKLPVTPPPPSFPRLKSCT